MSICNGCYTHDNSIAYREKYGESLCNGCSSIEYENMRKAMEVKEKHSKLKKLYKRLSKTDVYDISLWMKEMNISQFRELYGTKMLTLSDMEDDDE